MKRSSINVFFCNIHVVMLYWSESNFTFYFVRYIISLIGDVFVCVFFHACRHLVYVTFDVTQVFGTVHLNPHSSINRHNNFRTFPDSLMLLFRYIGTKRCTWRLKFNFFLFSSKIISQLQTVHRLTAISYSSMTWLNFSAGSIREVPLYVHSDNLPDV